MKKNLKVVLYHFFLFLSFALSAQDTVITYYNKNGAKTDDKNAAVFWSKGFQHSKYITWEVREYYMSNKIRMTGTYSNKREESKEGNFIYYYENGNKKAAGKFTDNQKEGTWTYWHENGQIQSTGLTQNNHQENIWTYYHENGVKSSEGLCVAGKLENTWTYYHDNGKKKSEGNYLNSKRINLWSFWKENGELKCDENYSSSGLVTITWYHSNGVKSAQGPLRNEERDGEWTFWNFEEKIYLRGSYVEGKQQGEWTRYFEESQNMKIVYEKGVATGKSLGGVIRFNN